MKRKGLKFTLEPITVDLPELPSLNIADVTNRFIKEQSERQNAILEAAIRENAIPPIKGEITKGKVRWRGLRMINKGSVADGFTETWIEQRGKRISPIIRNEFSYQLP